MVPFPKICSITCFSFSPFPVAIFSLHINTSTWSHPHHAPPKQAKGIEVNLFSLHFFQIHAHGFLTLGLPQSLTHPVFLTEALDLYLLGAWCQHWLRAQVPQERAEQGRSLEWRQSAEEQ